MRRHARQVSCFDDKPACVDPNRAPDVSDDPDLEELSGRLRRALDGTGVIARGEELWQLAQQLHRSIRHRRLAGRRWSKERLSKDDIIYLLQKARDSGQKDEAIWRAFLAAHFGRGSADPSVDGQAQSAFRLLCGFGQVPMWTWERVSKEPQAMHRWLLEHREQLGTLSYGNHRKYESKQPQGIWEVVNSFILLARTSWGSPSTLFAAEGVGDGAAAFDVLYRRLKPLSRFGRTGRFDFLTLLADLKLIEARPTSCYLHGATGPLAGARRLWGKRSTRSLDALAASLAVALDVSPQIVEDALCNWQKKL